MRKHKEWFLLLLLVIILWLSCTIVISLTNDSETRKEININKKNQYDKILKDSIKNP